MSGFLSHRMRVAGLLLPINDKHRAVDSPEGE